MEATVLPPELVRILLLGVCADSVRAMDPTSCRAAQPTDGRLPFRGANVFPK
jgi:hypothetical protein